MKKSLKGVLAVAALSLLSLPAIAGSEQVATAYRVQTPPVIDGKLDDSCWKNAQVLNHFWNNTSAKQATEPTEVRICNDDKYLYVGFICQEPTPKQILAKCTTPDGSVWTDDSVEIFLDPQGMRKEFYHLIVNTVGTIYDEHNDNITWNSGTIAKTSIGSKEWTAEIKIPFTSLGVSPKSGDRWTANFCRNREHDKEEYSTWSLTYGIFSNPVHFSILQFLDKGPATKLDVSKMPFWGLNNASLKVTNPSKSPMKLGYASAGLREFNSKITVQSLTLAPGQTKNIPLNVILKYGDEKNLSVMLFKGDHPSSIDPSRNESSLLSRWVLDINFGGGENFAPLMKQVSQIETDPNYSDSVRKSLTDKLKEAHVLINSFQAAAQQAADKKTTLDSKEWAEYQKKEADLSKTFNEMRAFIWQKDIWTNFDKNEMPADTTPIKDLKIRACVGEFEPTAFMVSNLGTQPFEGRMEISDFKPTDGGPMVIPADKLEVHDVMFMPLKNGRVMSDPLPLSSQINRIMVPVGETRQLYLQLDARDILPGEYEGTAQVIPFDRSISARTITLHLSIIPVRLPDQMPIAVYNWDYANGIKYVQDLLKHRDNLILVSSGICLPVCDDQGNVLKIDYTAHDNMLRDKSRFGTKVIYSYGIVRDFQYDVADPHHWAIMSEPWKKALKTWLTDFIGHIKSLGYDYSDFAMQSWDEATSDTDKVVSFSPFLRSIDPNVKWVMDGAQDEEEIRKMDPYIDIWIPNIAPLVNPDEGPGVLKLYHQIQAAGKPVWFYTCSTDMTALPVNSYYRLKPWLVWKFGLDGVCYWAYNSWRADSWNDFDEANPYSDNGVIYSGGDSPVTSKRWEASREGLDDYLYLYLLKSSIAVAKKSKINEADSEAFLNSLPEKVLSHQDDVAITEQAREQLLDTLLKVHAQIPFAGIQSWNTEKPVISINSGVAQIAWPVLDGNQARLYYKTTDDTIWTSSTCRSSAPYAVTEISDWQTHRNLQMILIQWDSLGRTAVSPVFTVDPTGKLVTGK